MYFLCRRQPSLFLTHLAKRVSADISVTDTFPGSTVGLVRVGSAFVTVIAAVILLSVLLTELLVRKVRTARVGTRSFWHSWNNTHLRVKKQANEKVPNARNNPIGLGFVPADGVVTPQMVLYRLPEPLRLSRKGFVYIVFLL